MVRRVPASVFALTSSRTWYLLKLQWWVRAEVIPYETSSRRAFRYATSLGERPNPFSSRFAFSVRKPVNGLTALSSQAVSGWSLATPMMADSWSCPCAFTNPGRRAPFRRGTASSPGPVPAPTTRRSSPQAARIRAPISGVYRPASAIRGPSVNRYPSSIRAARPPFPPIGRRNRARMRR